MKSGVDMIPETLDSILEGILTEEDDEDMYTEDSCNSCYSNGMGSPPLATAALPTAVCHTSVIVTNPQQQQPPQRTEIGGGGRSLLAEIFICYEKGRLLVKAEEEEEVDVKSESPDSCCSEDSLLVRL